MMEASVALDHRFNAIGIELLNVGGSHWTNHILSNPSNPSYILDFKSPYTDRMSFAERLHNTFIYLTNVLVYGQVILAMAQTRADKFFRYPGWEERPPIESLLANKSLVLMNTHPSMGYAVPTSPHFIQVGGISIVPNKPLPEDLKTYLDSATDGFVYFSLGSNIAVSNLLRGERLRSFTRALGSLKQKVVWKWEKDDFHEKPGNTITAPWFPQQDILGHKNCRLFITQGGIVSLTEALNYAVPVVGIPVFIDQRRNMMYVKSQGYGVTVELTNITEQSITWAVNEVLNNPTYRKMAEEKSAIFKDRPMSSLDTAVYWVEYAIRHKGAPHLKPALNLLPWYKSMLLDVAAVIFVALLTFGAAIYFLSKKLIHFAVKMALPKIPPRGQNLRQKLY
ncbi:hypothetical protein AAG570_011986 [Ranatra chinensis]|uniref:UDP-glucuronosyltransferase n=1 Tax=Ranatra chinensis TaxID=642074 RepID=A0ABD0YHH7_9HEMI